MTEQQYWEHMARQQNQVYLGQNQGIGGGLQGGCSNQGMLQHAPNQHVDPRVLMSPNPLPKEVAVQKMEEAVKQCKSNKLTETHLNKKLLLIKRT